MTKKKGLFSWLGKKSTEEIEQDEKNALLEAQRLEAESSAAQQLKDLKLKAKRLEAERLEAQRLEAERLEAERLEAERLEAERLEAQRLEAERVEAARLEAERLEAERLEAERLEAQQLEAQQLEAQQLEAQQLEAQQLEVQQLEAQQLEAQQLEAQQLEAQQLKVDKSSNEQQKTEAKAPGFFARFKQSLAKTRLSIGSGLFSLFRGKKIDADLFEELEEQLILADIGVDTTLKIIDKLTAQANRKQLKDAEALYSLLKEDLSGILEEVEQPLVIDEKKSPYVILMVGVNGVGKTTTIGKLAKKYQQQGKSVMLAAGDTFRAAAVEQLQVWGDRNNIPVIAQQTGADSASVLFDAMDAAKARGIDLLIADTAGRLQNKEHLMDELSKVVRIMRKKDPSAPHEIMLTIDASTGQNAISQADLFNKAVGITGITLTKLDGTAKGGVIFSIADKYKLPIRYIGTGEGIDDLREFNAREFIDALFAKEEEIEQGNK